MGTINSAFHLISGALNADQAALSIVAGNVANANTVGYTEEVANFQENQPIQINGMTYGAGVTETGATSIRDRVLNERLDQQQQLASASSSRLTALNSVQALFTPDSGTTASRAGDIGSDITTFFTSFSSLETNPSNNALRQQVLSSASTLSGDISNAAASLNGQSAALDQEAASVTSQVNALTTSLAKLNQQIQSTSPNADAGQLEDQRQHDLSQLSQLIGINQITTENNGITVTTTAGQTLVSEGKSDSLSTGMVNGVTHFFVGTSDITTQLATGGGQLGGLLTARDQDIPQALAALDQMAFGIGTEVNAQNAAGTDVNGNPGAAIFSPSMQQAGSALAMRVIMTNPSQVAAAAAGQGTGDNSNATALFNLSSSSAPSILTGLILPSGVALTAGQTLLNGQTPTNYFSGFVTSLGAIVAEVQTENTAQTASVTQLQTQSDSLSSVNLNNEASAMTTMERSYQAASQVFAMLNTIMASALNLGSQTTVS